MEKTPFYATMGGQQGDKGEIRTASGIFQVEETIKLRGGKVGHDNLISPILGTLGKVNFDAMMWDVFGDGKLVFKRCV